MGDQIFAQILILLYVINRGAQYYVFRKWCSFGESKHLMKDYTEFMNIELNVKMALTNTNFYTSNPLFPIISMKE